MKYFKRAVISILLSIAIPVSILASSEYSGTIDLTSTGSSYTMLAVSTPIGITQMVTDGYITDTGLDTRVLNGGTAIPHMLTTDKVYYALPVTVGVSPTLTFRTLHTPLLTDFDIVSGYNGYVTTLDNPDLELGNDFDIILDDTPVDTSLTGMPVFFKTGAIYTFFNSPGILTTAITGSSTTITQAASGGSQAVYSGSNQRVGQRFDPLQGFISSVSMYLMRVGSPTGNAYIRVRKVSDDSIYGTIGTIDVSTINNSSCTEYVFNTMLAIPSDNIRITFEWTGGDSSNYVRTYYDINLVAGQLTTYNASNTWVDSPIGDATFKITYAPATFVSKSFTTGEKDIIVSADTVNLSISIDGVSASTALGGASVPNNGNNMIWGSNAVPYFGGIKVYQGANYRINYDPDSIITTNVLPNEQVPGSYNGAFTFGTNPAGVTAVLTSFEPTNKATAGGPSGSHYGKMISDPSAPTGLYTELGGGIVGMDKVNEMLAKADVPQALFWFPLATIILCAIGIYTFKWTNSTLFETIIVGVGIGLLSGTIFPWWVLIVCAVIDIVFILHENPYG